MGLYTTEELKLRPLIKNEIQTVVKPSTDKKSCQFDYSKWNKIIGSGSKSGKEVAKFDLTTRNRAIKMIPSRDKSTFVQISQKFVNCIVSFLLYKRVHTNIHVVKNILGLRITSMQLGMYLKC